MQSRDIDNSDVNDHKLRRKVYFLISFYLLIFTMIQQMNEINS